MNIKVKEVYYVNEKKREVGCILKITDNHYCNWIFRVLKNIWRDGSNDNYSSIKEQFGFDSKFEFPSEIKGIAKCHPDDEWNTSIGRKVAREKAYEKFYKWCYKFEDRVKALSYYIYEEFTTGLPNPEDMYVWKVDHTEMDILEDINNNNIDE